MNALSAGRGGGADGKGGDTDGKAEVLAQDNGASLGDNSNESSTALVLKKTTELDRQIATTARKSWLRPHPPGRKTPLRVSEPELVYTSGRLKDDVLDFKQEISDDIASIQKKVAELGGLVDSYRDQSDDRISGLFNDISSLQTDVESLTVSLNKERRKKESENKRIKKLEEDLEASKQSWNDLVGNLKDVVSRAQLSLQNRRTELERAMTEFPEKQAAIQNDLTSIGLVVERLQNRIRSLDGRMAIVETEGEINARAWEEASANLDVVKRELPGTRGPFSVSDKHRNSAISEVEQQFTGDSALLGAQDGEESTSPPLAPLSDSLATDGSRSSTPPTVGSDSDSSLGISVRGEDTSSGLSSDWVEASDADSRADVETMPSDSGSPQLQFVDPTTVASAPDLVEASHSAVSTSDEGLLPSIYSQSVPIKYSLPHLPRDHEVVAKVVRFLSQLWATKVDTWKWASRLVAFNRGEALLWLIAFLAAWLLLLDPFQTRGLQERPAYRSFRLRQGLLPPSLPDTLEWILVSYLSVFMYLS